MQLHWLYSELEDQQVAPPTYLFFWMVHVKIFAYLQIKPKQIGMAMMRDHSKYPQPKSSIQHFPLFSQRLFHVPLCVTSVFTIIAPNEQKEKGSEQDAL